MSKGKDLLTIADLKDLIEDYYIILYPGNWDTYRRQVRRIIDSDLKKDVDYSEEDSVRCMTQAQALRFVTTNDSLRKYFLRVMDQYNETEEGKRLLRERFKSEDDKLAVIFAEEAERGEREIRQRIEPVVGTQGRQGFNFEEAERLYEEDELLSEQEVDKAATKALFSMFAEQGADVLFDYFGIDREKFAQAYVEYKALCRNVVNGGDFRGLSERRYKLQRPTIYYHV